MANITVRQPNGLLAIFSTVSDCFIHLNLTEDDAVSAYGDLGETRPIAEQKIKAGIEDRDIVDFGIKGNGLGRWKDCTDTIRQCQGERALNKLIALLK